MKESEILDKLAEQIVNFDAAGVKSNVEKALKANIPPIRIIMDGMSKGMEKVGRKYEEGEYFLAELIMAAAVFQDGMKLLEPYLEAEKMQTIGKVVIGTVKGDVHDIGKNIVAMMLSVAGFEVVDLGVDVEPEMFIAKVRETKPDIVAMSALLPITMLEMKTVIDGLREAGLRNKVKVLVGGSPVSAEFAKSISADAYGDNAVEGAKICKRWVKKS